MSTHEEIRVACERMQKAQRALLDYAANPVHSGLSAHPHLAQALQLATEEYIQLVFDLKP